jgi:hypothetical protein
MRGALNMNGHFVALYAGLHGLAQGLDQVLSAAEALRTETICNLFWLVMAQKNLLSENEHDSALSPMSVFLIPAQRGKCPSYLPLLMLYWCL